jgi:hypothetical protein
MKVNNQQILASTSTNGNSTSSPLWSATMVRASIQAVVTGANSAGTLQLQGSNDFILGGDNAAAVSQGTGPTNWFNVGSSVSVSGAGAYDIPMTELCYEWLQVLYTSTVTGVQTVAPIADTGVRQAQTVTTIADSSGSLNNTYFLLSSINKVTKAQKNFYMWFDINSAGTDPAIAGRTGIHVTGATNASANTLASSMRTALNALTNDFAATGANAAVIITDVAFGPVTAAVDGAVPTGFTFGSATAGVASNLNNKWFQLNSEASAHKYYVWMNVDGIGTDPAPAGLTACEVDFNAGSSAGTIGSALATAVAALNSTNDFTTSGTTTVTITNKTAGPFVPITDGTAPTTFTFAVTTANGTIVMRAKSQAL